MLFIIVFLIFSVIPQVMLSLIQLLNSLLDRKFFHIHTTLQSVQICYSEYESNVLNITIMLSFLIVLLSPILNSCTHFLLSILSSYYHLFSGLYSLVGRCADLVLVNGTWTYNHIVAQWRQPTSIYYFSSSYSKKLLFYILLVIQLNIKLFLSINHGSVSFYH